MSTIVHTPTPDLVKSLDFYSRLKFKTLDHDQMNLVTDGSFIIEINPVRFARAGLKIFRQDWSARIGQLVNTSAILKTDTGFILNDPSGIWIYLEESSFEIDLPDTKTNSVMGNFMGMGIECLSMEHSLEFWRSLGFKENAGSVDAGWISLANDDGFGVSLMKPLMCPHLFFNPSLSFFNSGKNPEVIQNIRELNIPITEEITHFNKDGEVDNIIVRDPGGYGFFVFND